MDPVVSVIVPNFNHARFLRERMDSILKQTVPSIEVILLDDASTDGSVEILRSYAQDARVTHLVVNEHNSGSPFVQWRKGIALARGTWIWIAESDDACATDLVQRLLTKVDQCGGKPGLVYAQSQVIDEAGGRISSMLSHTRDLVPDPFAHDLDLEGVELVRRYLKVNASAVLFKRELAMGPDIWEGTATMTMCGDWLFWVRLCQRTRVGFVADELNHFRTHASVSRSHRSMERKRTRILEETMVRNALAEVPGMDQRAEELRMYRAWSRSFAVRDFLGPAFDAARLIARSRPSFLFICLRMKWRDRINAGRST